MNIVIIIKHKYILLQALTKYFTTKSGVHHSAAAATSQLPLFMHLCLCHKDD